MILDRKFMIKIPNGGYDRDMHLIPLIKEAYNDDTITIIKPQAIRVAYAGEAIEHFRKRLSELNSRVVFAAGSRVLHVSYVAAMPVKVLTGHEMPSANIAVNGSNEMLAVWLFEDDVYDLTVYVHDNIHLHVRNLPNTYNVYVLGMYRTNLGM